jgi:hypothetical protein
MNQFEIKHNKTLQNKKVENASRAIAGKQWWRQVVPK